MSGHSKWSQIKRGKAVTDAAKSRVFSRFARLITLESKKSGGSVNDPGLAAAIARAKAANMPKENIERAIAKGASKDASDLEQVVYEAYGPGGAAVVMDALTDNRNRTTQEIKHLLSKNGVELAAPGAASWAFSKAAGGAFAANEPLVEVSGEDEEKLGALLTALDEHDDVQRVFTNARGYESTEGE
ncbi:YebC/PmpR family DNA-binding transcriptional regulator [Patescibacteria group bacterium]|nr:YebC/PmpR family DNA-binding transcriptional regulator [Patescibacteria group bacterium]